MSDSDTTPPSEDDLLQKLIDEPGERIGVELKSWLDPSMPADVAKIAKACLALRNNNGGNLVIGIEDDCTLSPNPPPDVRKTYHPDVIQQIVSKYAADPFAVDVEWRSRDGQDYPIIVVPRGIQVPVAAKSTLRNPNDSKKNLIADHDIYVRSVSSNHRVSSTKLRRQDIPRLMQLCFDNREADIGNFVRRHLSGLTSDVLRGALTAVSDAVEPEVSPIDLLDSGFTAFQAALQSRNSPFPDAGFLEASAMLRDVPTPRALNQELLHHLQSVRRDLSGWGPWTYIYNPKEAAMNPYVAEGQRWEALMGQASDGVFPPLMDFWQINPAGQLYYIRALEDDLSAPQKGVDPRTFLDFYLVAYRTTEVVLSVLQMSQVLTAAVASTIDLAFRWRGLSGRVLNSWSQPGRRLRRVARAHDNIVASQITMTRDTPESAIPSLVHQAVQPVFLAFEGYDLPREVIEEIARSALGRNL